MRRLFSICLFFFASASAQSPVVYWHTATETNLATYKVAKDLGGQSWDNVSFYVAGLGSALVWQSAIMTARHMSTTFCVPEALRLNRSNFTDMLDAALLRKHHYDIETVDLILINAMEFTFPCNPK